MKNMKVVKIVLVCLILVIIIISIFLIKLKIEMEKEGEDFYFGSLNKEDTAVPDEEQDITKDISNRVEIVKNRDDFFAVEKCASEYFNAIVDKDIDTILTMLDDEYEEKMGINKDNVMGKIEQIDSYNKFKAIKIYELDSFNYETYFVYGTIQNDEINEVNERQEVCITVKFDYTNDKFYIKPYGYMLEDKKEETKKNQQVSVANIDYICYMDRCEVTMKVKNNTNQTIDTKDNISIKYYEEREGSIESRCEESISIKPQQVTEIKLQIPNQAAIPQSINIFGIESEMVLYE